MEAFQELTNTINTFIHEQDPKSIPMSLQEVAMGFIKVANETMCRPIRALTQVSVVIKPFILLDQI